MATAKIAITLEQETLNRSKAIQQAVQEKLDRLKRSRLAPECAKLDPSAEKAMAEAGISLELNQWPEY